MSLEPLIEEGQTIFYCDKEYYVKSLNHITNNEIDITLHEVKAAFTTPNQNKQLARSCLLVF